MHVRVNGFNHPPDEGAKLETQLADGSWATLARWVGPDAHLGSRRALDVLVGLADPERVVFVARAGGQLLAHKRGEAPTLVAEFHGVAAGALAAVAALRLSGEVDPDEASAALERLAEEVVRG